MTSFTIGLILGALGATSIWWGSQKYITEFYEEKMKKQQKVIANLEKKLQ